MPHLSDLTTCELLEIISLNRQKPPFFNDEKKVFVANINTKEPSEHKTLRKACLVTVFWNTQHLPRFKVKLK